ncbi:MAG: hypothetical protein H7281_04110 [Bacteriovorax sp.]|nr:hypothetical protein [Bacteriovorax sp.]
MRSYFSEEIIQKILKYAAVFNIVCGLFLVISPNAIFKFWGVPIPNIIEIWQYLGSILVIFGIGYYIASLGPDTSWPIILVGFLSKIFGVIMLFKAYLLGSLALNFFSLVLFIDVLWILPFYYALIYAYEVNTLEESAPKKFYDLIKVVRTSKGDTLSELSKKENVLLVFVRHFGCTFCRETVSEIAKLDESIRGKKLTPVFVHMSDPSFGDEFFAKYYKDPVAHVSDPQRFLYKSLNLKRGSLSQLFGPKIWIRGLWAGIFKGHGLGSIESDALQLGGYFILSHGQIVFEHKTKDAADFFKLQLLPKA